MVKFSVYRKLLIVVSLVACVFLLRTQDVSVTSIATQGFQRMLLEKDDTTMNELCSSVTSSPFSSEDASRAQGVVEKLRGANPLIKIINSHDLGKSNNVTESQQAVIDAYYSTMTPIIILMWIFFLIALYCYFGLFCTARGVGKKYFRFFWIRRLGTKKKYLDGFSFILLLFLIFLGIGGNYLSEPIAQRTDNVLCTWDYFLDDMEQGSPNNKWLGLIPLSNLLITLKDFMSVLEKETEELKNMSRVSINPYTHFINAIAKSSFIFAVRDIPRADPEITEPYLPDFIIDFGSLNSPVKTEAQYILNELNYRDHDVRSAVSRIFVDFHYYLRTKKEDLSHAVKLTSGVTNGAFTGIQGLTSLSRGYSQSIKKYSDTSKPLLEFTFRLVCIISSMSLLFWFLVLGCRKRIVTCLNVGWWLLSGFSMLGWITSLVIIPTNIRFMETCGALKKGIDDPVFFNKTMDLFVDHSSSVNQYLYTCIHGNADIPSTFGLYGPTKRFTELYSDHMLDSLGIILKEFPEESVRIPNLIKKLANYGNGIEPDSHETITDLKKLNSYTSFSNDCGTIRDTWMLSGLNCTSEMGRKFNEKHDADFNVGKPTCIGFDHWTGYDIKSIKTRYEGLLKDCKDEVSIEQIKKAQNFVEGFVTNRVELTRLTIEMSVDLKQLSYKYKDHIKVLNSFSQISTEIGDDLTALNNTLFYPKTGLMSNMNCQIIMKDFQAFQNNLCSGLIPNIFEISTIITLISAVSTLAACSMFFLSRNIREYDLNYKKVDVYTDFSAYSQIADGTQDQEDDEDDEEEEEDEDSEEDEEEEIDDKNDLCNKSVMQNGYSIL